MFLIGYMLMAGIIQVALRKNRKTTFSDFPKMDY